MQKLLYFLLVSLSVAVLAACGTNDQVEGDQPDEHTENVEDGTGGEDEAENSDEASEAEETAIHQAELPELEASKQATLMIEGMEEETTVHLFQHEELGFSTYVPQDMIAGYENGFFNGYANFNDNKNEDARLFITAKDQAELTAYLEEKDFNLSAVDTPAYDFSEIEMTLEKAGFVGRVAFFMKQGQAYALGYYYPAEYGDGFSARSHIITDEIIWHEN